jgi:hypothetical protein
MVPPFVTAFSGSATGTRRYGPDHDEWSTGGPDARCGCTGSVVDAADPRGEVDPRRRERAAVG